MAKKEKIYLKNKDLYIEIVISKAQGELTPRAQQMLLLLANRAINKFESLHLADKIEYKFNGTYYRVGLYISENDWQQANKKHGLPFWILQ